MGALRTIMIVLTCVGPAYLALAQVAPPVPVPKPSSHTSEGPTADDLEYAALPRAKGVDPAKVCGGKLATLGIALEPLEPIKVDICSVAAPVSVTSFGNRTIQLTEQAVLNCAMAEKLALWLRDSVDPAAERILGGRLAGLRLKGSYKCRSVNWDDDQRMSQHAFGNAIDITAFQIGDQWITVGQAAGKQEEFLNAVRNSACDHFTTVLGPGSNANHADHLHVDLAKRWAIFRRLYCR
jgi:hypothetical protein